MESTREALHPEMFLAGSSLAACADKLMVWFFSKGLPQLKVENIL